MSLLNDEEKEILSEMIKNGWVSKNGDRLIHNFSIFTKAQAESLIGIFDEIYDDLKNVIHDIFVEAEKFCRSDLPQHLESYLNYHVYMTLHKAHKIMTALAYYDGKIHDPKDEVECGMLTFHVIKNSDG